MSWTPAGSEPRDGMDRHGWTDGRLLDLIPLTAEQGSDPLGFTDRLAGLGRGQFLAGQRADSVVEGMQGAAHGRLQLRAQGVLQARMDRHALHQRTKVAHLLGRALDGGIRH